MRCGHRVSRMSSRSCVRCSGIFRTCFALANRSQIMPGVNSAGVAIVPIEADGITPDRPHLVRTRSGLEHWQRCFRLRLRLTRFSAGGLTLFDTGGARAGIAQPGKSPLAGMAVFPGNFNASAFRLIYPDVLGLDGLMGQLPLLLSGGFPGDMLRHDADPLMTHNFPVVHPTSALVSHGCDASDIPAPAKTM